MAYQFTTISENDWGNGIDQQSAENNVKPGFVEDLINGDPKPEGYIAKRVGYQGYAGNIPVRVSRIDYTGTNLCFTLDNAITLTSVDLSRVRSTPIYVQGKLSVTNGGSGDFSNLGEAVSYYTGFTIDTTLTLLTGTNTLSLTAADHGQGTPFFMPRFYQSTHPTDNSNAIFYPDSIAINKTTYDMDVTYTNSTGSSFPIFVTYSKRNAGSYIAPSLTNIPGTNKAFTATNLSEGSATITINSHGLIDGTPVIATFTGPLTGITSGNTYYVVNAATNTFELSSTVGGLALTLTNVAGTAGTFIAPPSTATITVPAGTHSQSNFNLQVELWQDDGTSYISVVPDSVTINTAGLVTIVLTNSGPSAIDVFPVITSVAVSNKHEEILSNPGNPDIIISDLPEDFVGASIYVKTPATGLLTQVIPENISEDADTRTLTVEMGFNNPAYAAYFTANNEATFVIFWENLRITANKLCVTAHTAAGTSIVDDNPQITIWGLDHADIYGAAPVTSRPGWVTHLDTYRSATGNNVVAGLGGNLFQALDLPNPLLYYPNLRSRVAISPVSQTIGPAFWGLTDSPSRTTGYIKFDGGEENWARASSIVWISGNTVEYTLETPSRTNTGTPVAVNADRLTVDGSGWLVNNGTFEITAVDYTDANKVKIRVTNSQRDNSDFNETDSGARTGIFTSQLTLNATSHFISNDRLLSDLFTDSSDLRVVESAGAVLTIGSVVDSYTLPAGLSIVASRQGRVLPLRNLTETPTITNLVKGDMCFYNGYTRPLRIKYVNSNSDASVTLTGDGETTEITVANSSSYSIGQRILLVQAGDWDGEHVITDIPTTTTITVDSLLTGSGTATLIGKTVELDESLTLTDDPNSAITLTVPLRWQPVEAPSNSGGILPQTWTTHFPSGGYGDQAILRSVMSSDNLYLTNGQDQVMKMDGDNVYRAGLPRWQPQAFITVDENPSNLFIQGRIEIPDVKATSSTRSGTVFTIPKANESTFTVGDNIYDTANHQIYTITGISSNATETYISVSTTISYATAGESHVISKAYTYRYYFRLNAIDANGNIIASAVTGHQDNIVYIEHSSQIRIRLIGFPAWDNYDYDRLEIQVYRTKLNTVAPFYLVSTVPLTYDNNTGYIDIVDTKQDADFPSIPDDPTSVLSGPELGTQWSGPLRSKYITSAANKLILGNVETDSQLDIRILEPSNSGPLTTGQFHGKRFLFRKDNTDSDITTDNLNRIAFEFRDTTVAPLTITGISNGGGTTQFTVTTSIPHGLVQNNWVYLTLKTPETDWSYTSYDQATDELVGSIAHGYSQGQRVVLYSVSPPNTTPSNQLVNTGVYYVITNYVGSTPTRLKLASSLANALAGTAINLVTGGGSYGNLEPHTQVNMKYTGWWQIASVGAEPSPITFTINYNHSNPDGTPYTPAADGWECNIAVRATDGRDVPVWLGFDNAMESTSARSTFIQNRVVDRLSKAINASQRLCRTAGFDPWLIAGAGQDYASGQLSIMQPKSLSTTTELQLPSFTEFLVFVNNVQRTSDEAAGAVSYKYPSRILASYTNYAELFDNVTTTDPDQSASVIDVNSADGQEITGIIPFFGESAFGAALRSGVLVVFKTNSIYLVDLAEKAAGRNPVQRIESQGLGCTAPHSIANTRDGIMFANESGIYKLTRSMAVEYVGRKTERIWRNRVNRDALELAFGHHYSTGSQYKLAVPLDGGTSPGDLLVYSHVREYQGGIGAWSRYSHSPAIGWCNLASDAFFASINGRVYSIRRANDNTDYRDDDQPISFEATLRAMDFGDGGIRKVIHYVISKFRVLKDASGTVLSTAADLNDNFIDADSFRIESPTDNTNGLNDANAVKVQTIRFSIDNRKLVFLQVRLTNSTIDEPVEITEVSVRVAGMTDKGITSAART